MAIGGFTHTHQIGGAALWYPGYKAEGFVPASSGTTQDLSTT